MDEDLDKQPAAMDRAKAAKAVAGMVRDPTSGDMVKRKKSKPLKVIERDMEIIRLMHLVQDASVVAQKMGVTKRRVYQIVAEYKDAMKDELGRVDPSALASQAISRYELLFNETIKLAVEAVKIPDPKDRIAAKGVAYERAIKAQSALDNLFKLLGIYKEHKVIEHVDLLKTEEWLRMEEAIRIFLRMYVGIDPSVFTDFVERVQADPAYFRYIKAQAEDRERRQGLYKPDLEFSIDDFRKSIKEKKVAAILENVRTETRLAKGEAVDAEFRELNDEGEDDGRQANGQGTDRTETGTGTGHPGGDEPEPVVHVISEPDP